MKTIFENFTKKYSVSKTLRFELIAREKTQEHIEKQNFLNDDEKLAEKYKKAKKIIDEYHKNFISNKLSSFTFTLEELRAYEQAYQAMKKDKKNIKLINDFASRQDDLRKRIAKELQEDNYLYAKEGEKKKFIKQNLIKWLENHAISISGIPEPKAIINDFENWTNYFSGFNDNRKNIYSEKRIGTSIGYRLVHDNLPKYLENIKRFNKAKTAGVNFSNVEKTYRVKLDEVFSLEHFNKCLTQKGIDEYNLIRGGQSKKGNNKEQGINETINLHVQQLHRKLERATDDDKKDLADKIKYIKSCLLEELYKQILSDRSQLSFRLDSIKNDGELCRQIEHIFHTDNENNLWGKKENVVRDTGEKTESDFNISEAIKKVVQAFKEADPGQLYIRNKSSNAITEISQHLFGNWSLITRSLNYYAEKIIFPNPEKKKETAKQKVDREKKCEGWLKDTTYFSFAEIHTALEIFFQQYSDEELRDEKKENNEEEQGITKAVKEIALGKPLFSYFKELKISKKNEKTNKFEKKELLKQIKESYPAAQKVFEQYGDVEEELLKNKKDIEVRVVKNYLDALMDLQHYFKPLYVTLTPKDEKNQEEIFEKDNGFYDDFDPLFNVLDQIVPLYNQVRNYLTKKPFSIEKYKLNFGHHSLLGGFVDSYTDSDNATQYGAYLFRKKHQRYDAYEYFLGISTDAKLFRCHLQNDISENDKSEYERLEYYQPKSTTFFSDEYSNKNKQKIMDCLLRKVETKIEKTSNGNSDLDEFLGKLRDADTPGKHIEIIKKQKEFINILYEKEVEEIFNEAIAEMKNFTIKYVERNPQLIEVQDKPYAGCEGFTAIIRDLQKIAKENKVFNYFPVSENEFNEACNRETKPLLFFKITNKDLSYYEKASQGLRKKEIGTKNLHTLYFEQLLSGEQQVIDIGKGEIFHRRKTPFYEPIIHRKNELILCRTYNEDGNQKTVPDDIYKELSLFYKGNIQEDKLSDASKKLKNLVKANKFDYEIKKDKRYTEDKYLFHLSINLNFDKSPNLEKFNDSVNDSLKHYENVKILGIDRGERHLIYYTLIDDKGNILKDENGNYLQGSLNNPTGKKDYRDLLDKREGERDKDRKAWNTIDRIKDLKEGYLSQVVHNIALLMIKYNAIVAFEDLNFGFKRGRMKVEKQVYQKLEKMLIDKLNYLVFKNVSPEKPGGLLNAFQITAPFKSFKAMGKQTGFIFYVPAYHTSKICPLTGFTDLLYPNYETVKKSREFFEKFEVIRFNRQANYFEFEIKDYDAFNPKAEDTKQDWTICTRGLRLDTYRNPKKNNNWDTQEVDLTKELQNLMQSQGIQFIDGKCIKEEICRQSDSQFFKRLMKLLKLTLQIRNSRVNSYEDWIISPVRVRGKIFDSRDADESMPQNADANGAYHIALKGLWCLQQIQEAKDLKKVNLAISNKEWLQFVQDRPFAK